MCKYGDSCSFAHGEHELQKKTHVASKYRMSMCTDYEKGCCMRGSRCPFLHSAIDCSDFDEQRTRFQNLLAENARIMTERIEKAADPEISVFNVAYSSRNRLSVFAEIVPENSLKNRTKKRGQKHRAAKQLKKAFAAESF